MLDSDPAGSRVDRLGRMAGDPFETLRGDGREWNEEGLCIFMRCLWGVWVRGRLFSGLDEM